MLGRIACDFRPNICGYKSGIYARVALEDRSEVAVFPACISLKVEYVYLLVYDSDTSCKSVVLGRYLVIKRFDDGLDAGSAFLIDINIKINLFKLYSSVQFNHSGGNTTIVEEHG